MRTHFAHTSRRSLVTYKEPRNDAATCPFVREETDRSPRNMETEGGSISSSDSRIYQHAILSPRPVEQDIQQLVYRYRQ